MKITCKNLAIGYDNKVLHKDINFTIPQGAYVGVVGENGIGKSTLIKTLLGLLPPISGEIFIGDKTDKFLIGYLPQQTQIQRNFPASVFEVTISGCLNKVGFRPFYNKSEKSLAMNNLKKLGISALAQKSYSELSGGQQQRTLLARALCATKDILLLDEPTTGLDIYAQEEFYSIVKNLNAEGVTIIMITHNIKDVIYDIDYVLSLKESGVECISSTEYSQTEAILK